MMVPTFSAVLLVAAIGVSIFRVHGLREVGGVSQFLGVAAVLFGLILVWDRTKYRYGFTHDLKWSLSSKKVDLAVAVVIAGITVSTLSVVLLR